MKQAVNIGGRAELLTDLTMAGPLSGPWRHLIDGVGTGSR